jgi:hypothetical protein
MKILLALGILAVSASAYAADTIRLPDGRSPDGKYSIRIHPPVEDGAIPKLEVINRDTKAIIGTTDTGGYAHFKAVANSFSTAALWSPDSKHLALMTRGTKRSTNIRVFEVSAAGISEIVLPSPTDRAFQLLKATDSYRCVFQRPKKWIDNDSLVIEASGDVTNPAGDKIPIWYEVDVTLSVSKKKITDAKVISTKSQEG